MTFDESDPAQCFQHLQFALAEVVTDLQKAIGGNGAACTRARKQLQVVKRMAQLTRDALLEKRKEPPRALTPAEIEEVCRDHRRRRAPVNSVLQ